MPQIRFNLDRTKAQRLGVAVSDVFTVLQVYLGGYYVNDFNLYGKVWKVMVQAEGSRRVTKDDIEHLYVLNQNGQRVRLDSLGDAVYALGPIDAPHYNMYNAAKITGQPALGYSSGQAIAAMERVAERDSARRVFVRMDRHDVPGTEDRQSGVVHLRAVDRLRVPVHGGSL